MNPTPEPTFTVNGSPASLAGDLRRPLADVLRDELGLTGTKTGCRTGDCGTCTVLVDGQARVSCLTPAAHAVDRDVTTVEGLGTPDAPHPLQRTFTQLHASQCGYCIPGILVSAAELLATDPPRTRGEVQEGLSGNLCRCTGYERIVDAILAAAAEVTELAGVDAPAVDEPEVASWR